MTAKVHRGLMSLSQFLAGLGALWALTDYEALGLDPQIGIGVALAGAVAGLAANSWRSFWGSE